LFSLRPAGKRHPLRVNLPKETGYELKFSPDEVEAKKCWRPYLTGQSSKVLIVYTEPQFFRLDEHGFVRHQDVNSDSADELRRKCSWLNSKPKSSRDIVKPKSSRDIVKPKSSRDIVKPKSSRHFVSSGEADAVLTLTQWFERLGVTTEFLCAHHWADKNVTHQNLILIGNKRTFPEMAEMVEQEGFDYLIQDHHIENKGNSNERKLLDVFSDNKPVKGVVSRFYSSKLDSWITAFASNHGRFFEAAVRALTSDHETRLLWKGFGVEDAPDPPDRFELIGEARVRPHEEAVRSHSISWIAKQCGKGAVVGE